MLRIKVEQQQITNIKEKYDEMVNKSNDPAEGQKEKRCLRKLFAWIRKFMALHIKYYPRLN